MKHPETHLVTEKNGPCRAGKPDECFYCKAPIGSDHAEQCILRRRTVMVRIYIDYPIAVPESWSEDDINFHRNESSWCANNALKEIVKLFHDDEATQCLCPHATTEYIGEANAEQDAMIPRVDGAL